MPVDPEILEDCRRRFSAGESNDEIIGHLRRSGLSKVDTIMVFFNLNRATMNEAKRLVHLSPAWKDMYQRDERFHDKLERLAKEMSDENKKRQ